MATDINLLPGELKPKGYALKLAKTLRKVAIVSSLLFFIALILYIGSSIMFTLELRSISKNEEILKNEITVLKNTEQKLVFIQDRLVKIQSVLGDGSQEQRLNYARAIAEKTDSGITLGSITINPSFLKITIISPNSSSTTKFFRDLGEINFKNIQILSYTFDLQRGYLIELALGS